MKSTLRRARFLGLGAIVVATGLTLAGCSGGAATDGPVTLSILVDNTDTTINTVQALADAFVAENPDITVELEERPTGSDGDNVVRTRLQTGDMTDLFYYNSGALLQGLSPQNTLTDLSGEDFMANVSDTFKLGVTSGDAVYGVPVGNAMGGGILYNKKVFADLGLQVPTTWDEFMSNNEAIKAAGIAPVIQSYGPDSTWTSQLFVLGDFYNVQADSPDFAADFTANEANFSDTPEAQDGFQHLQDVREAGYLNEDFGSLTYGDALKSLTDGTGAQYPMLTFAVTEIQTNYPDAIDNIGFFAIPGDDAANAGLTTWLSAALYLPASNTEHKEAALKFLEFVASPAGCDAQTEAVGVTGPYFIEGCTIPSDVPPAVADLTKYIDSGLTAPALEFLSPVKGPTLEQITVAVGSGIQSASDGAAAYDADAKKQAQQLGLEGW